MRIFHPSMRVRRLGGYVVLTIVVALFGASSEMAHAQEVKQALEMAGHWLGHMVADASGAEVVVAIMFKIFDVAE